MEGTMDLNEHYKIGGSVYRAKINGRVLAVKKTKDDVTEELKILQKVSHANLVKLMGIVITQFFLPFYFNYFYLKK